MIPLFATIQVSHPRGSFRFLAPLFLLWLVLLPFAVILAAPCAIVCLAMRVNPVRAAGALVGVLTGITGTRVEVDSPGASVLIHIV